MAKVITAIMVERIKPEKKRKEIPDGGLSGFYLIVQPSGKKSWVVRYRHKGTQHKYTVGAYPAFKVGEAREAARLVLRQVAEGIDPSAEKKRLQHAAMDVSGLIEKFGQAYIEYRCERKDWKPRYEREARRIFRKEILPHWAGRRIKDISPNDIILLLQNIVRQSKGRGTPANSLYSKIISPLFKFALDIREINSSPVPSRELLLAHRALVEDRKRNRILKEHELILFWKVFTLENSLYGYLFKLMMVLGQRRSEVVGMTRDEIDFDKRIWSLSSERTKNRKPHVVPLSDLAISLIRAVPLIPNPNNYIFCANGETPISSFSRAKDRILGLVIIESPDKFIPPWTVHDLRRTMITIMNELNIAPHVVEVGVNHISGGAKSGVAGVYNHAQYWNERKIAFDTWARYIERITRQTPDNVTELHPCLESQ